MRKIGIIGGSGLEKISGVNYLGQKSVDTKYGEPSMPFSIFEFEGAEFYITNRHGVNHNLSPNRINYQANITAFKMMGVDSIIAISAVGGINSKYDVGSLVLLDNAIDKTSGRVSTFFDEGDVNHIDLTYPFCNDLRQSLISASNDAGVKLCDGGIYICTNGPRLETAAEIKYYRSIGADVVGMTLFPEVSLSRESEICYASIAIVTNYAAGVVAGKKLTSDEIVENGAKAARNIETLMSKIVKFLPEERSCKCANALSGAKI